MSLREIGCEHCYEGLVEATCAVCGRVEKNHGDVGEVADWLRNKRGWKIRPAAKVTDPSLWVCCNCYGRDDEKHG